MDSNQNLYNKKFIVWNRDISLRKNILRTINFAKRMELYTILAYNNSIFLGFNTFCFILCWQSDNRKLGRKRSFIQALSN